MELHWSCFSIVAGFSSLLNSAKKKKKKKRADKLLDVFMREKNILVLPHRSVLLICSGSTTTYPVNHVTIDARPY